MSKAFTRESDDSAAPEIIFPKSVQPQATSRFITREGAVRFESQLRDLMEKKQDLLNNGGKLKKDAVLDVDIQIQKLQSLLANAVVVSPPADLNKVAFGAYIRVRENNGEEETYQIVGPAEAEPAEGRISSTSPLARALLSRKTGHKVQFQTPGGPTELSIIQVSY